MTIYYGSIAHLLMGKNKDTTGKSKQQQTGTTKKKRSGTDTTQVRQRKKANDKKDNNNTGSGPMMDILYSMTQTPGLARIGLSRVSQKRPFSDIPTPFHKVSLVKTDSIVFRLHCNATVILLVTFSIAVTTRQYVGNPIDCVHTRDIPEEVLNTYCWIHSTYIVESAILKKVGKEVAYPGVDNSKMSKGPVRHVKYYQWVAFMLFFQILILYGLN